MINPVRDVIGSVYTPYCFVAYRDTRPCGHVLLFLKVGGMNHDHEYETIVY